MSDEPTVIDEVFDKAQAIERRWRHWAGVRFRWRMGRDAYEAIVVASAPPPPTHILDDVDPRFAAISAEEEAYGLDIIRRGREAWGKEGSTLLGWPVVCDETFHGIEPEVARL